MNSTPHDTDAGGTCPTCRHPWSDHDVTTGECRACRREWFSDWDAGHPGVCFQVPPAPDAGEGARTCPACGHRNAEPCPRCGSREYSWRNVAPGVRFKTALPTCSECCRTTDEHLPAPAVSSPTCDYCPHPPHTGHCGMLYCSCVQRPAVSSPEPAGPAEPLIVTRLLVPASNVRPAVSERGADSLPTLRSLWGQSPDLRADEEGSESLTWAHLSEVARLAYCSGMIDGHRYAHEHEGSLPGSDVEAYAAAYLRALASQGRGGA